MTKLPKLVTLIPLILGLVLISGCAFSQAPPTPGEEEQEEGEVPGVPTEDRKIVRQGSITLEVEDIAETMDGVAQIAEELKGYVISSYKREYERGVSGHIAIRVPVDKFDEAFVRLRQLAIAVPFETTEAKDVTEEYVDLEAQLSNLRATEARYLALLEKAATVEEILKVQRELSNVRGRLSKSKGACNIWSVPQTWRLSR